MYKRTLAAVPLLTLTVTFSGSTQVPQTQSIRPTQQKAPLSEAKVVAKTASLPTDAGLAPIMPAWLSGFLVDKCFGFQLAPRW